MSQETVRILWIYHTLNVKFSSSQCSQFSKLKPILKNDTQVTLKLSSNVVGDSNDKTNFPRKLLLIVFVKPLQMMKFSKTQLYKMM